MENLTTMEKISAAKGAICMARVMNRRAIGARKIGNVALAKRLSFLRGSFMDDARKLISAGRALTQI